MQLSQRSFSATKYGLNRLIFTILLLLSLSTSTSAQMDKRSLQSALVGLQVDAECNFMGAERREAAIKIVELNLQMIGIDPESAKGEKIKRLANKPASDFPCDGSSAPTFFKNVTDPIDCLTWGRNCR